MLVALVGAACAGKKTIAGQLVADHGFTHVALRAEPGFPDGLLFNDAQALLDYATANWQKDLVTSGVSDCDTIARLAKRPWFVLVLVEARLCERWRRWVARLGASSAMPSLLDFACADDDWRFGTRDATGGPDDAGRNALSRLAPFVALSLLNADRADSARSVGGAHVARMRACVRPGWDEYFMGLAVLASSRSNCMKRRVGAVLVTTPQRTVLSTGYNGTARGMRNCSDGGCARCNGPGGSSGGSSGRSGGAMARCGEHLDECLCLHAEENALLEAGRHSVGRAQATTLYCNTCPCLRCSIKIVQCGVREVVYSLGYSMDAGAAAVFAEAGIQLRQLPMSAGESAGLGTTMEL